MFSFSSSSGSLVPKIMEYESSNWSPFLADILQPVIQVKASPQHTLEVNRQKSWNWSSFLASIWQPMNEAKAPLQHTIEVHIQKTSNWSSFPTSFWQPVIQAKPPPQHTLKVHPQIKYTKRLHHCSYIPRKGWIWPQEFSRKIFRKLTGELCSQILGKFWEKKFWEYLKILIYGKFWAL